MNFRLCLASEVDSVWPSIAQGMQRACDKTGGASSAGELWQMCRNSEAFFIIGFDERSILVASIWRFETWPSGTVFRCLAMTGHRPAEWVEGLRDFVMPIARDGGTQRVIAQGRKGLHRLFQRHLSRPVKVLWETYEVDYGKR